MPSDAAHYFAMMLDDQPYAVIRRTGGLLERWSPDRGTWTEALFHWDTFFGKGDPGERRGISREEADALAEAAESGVPYQTPIDPPPGFGPRHDQCTRPSWMKEER